MVDSGLIYEHPLLRDWRDCEAALRSGDMGHREFLDRFGKLPPIAGKGVPGAGYTVTWTAQALTAATARTIAAVLTGANSPVDLPEFSVSGDATSGNLLIELVYCTAATNSTIGTNNTTFTPLQFRGPTQTFSSTAGIAWTAGNEPTVETVIKRWRYAWPGGPIIIQSPLGRELNSIPTAATSGKMIGFRLTSSTSVTNCDGYLEVEE